MDSNIESRCLDSKLVGLHYARYYSLKVPLDLSVLAALRTLQPVLLDFKCGRTILKVS